MNQEPIYSTRVLAPYIKLLRQKYPLINTDELLAYAGLMPWEAADQSHWITQEQVNRFYYRALDMTAQANLAREAGQLGVSSETYGAVHAYALSFINPHAMFSRIGAIVEKLSRSSSYTSRPLSGNAIEVVVALHPEMQEEPFQCENRLGVFEAGVRMFNYNVPIIEHTECLFQGGKVCRYIIRWDKTRSAHIKQAQNYGLPLWLLINLLVAVKAPLNLLVSVPLSLLGHTLLDRWRLSEELKEVSAGLVNLENTRDHLIRQLDTNYNNTQMTSEIGQVISSQTSIDTVLQAVVKVLKKRLDFDRGMVLLASEDRTRLIYRAGFGHTDEEREILAKASFRLDNPESKGVFIKAFNEQTPFLVDDFEEFERRHTLQSVRLAKALGVKSFVCCPIICDREAIGVLAVDNLKSSRPLMQSDKSLLMGIAPVIGVSIRNAELLLAKEKEFHSTLQVLAASIDARDPLTAGHSEKVTEYSIGICDELKLNSDFRECVRVASLLHDYGKIGVPDSILKKQGRLTTAEYEIIKTHTSQTRDILERINFEGKYRHVPLIAGSHHEKWNGNGYPQGLKGKEIHLGARIIAVADHFEAITSKRHYRDPMPIEIALQELQKHSGSYFDPEVVEAFINYYRRFYNGHGGPEDGGGGGICRIRQKRVSVEMPSVVQTRAHTYTACTHDISLNGVYLSVPDDLGKGLFVKIEILLPGQTLPVVASGRIAWVNNGENRPKPHYPDGCGIEIITFDDASDELLQRFLHQHLQPGGLTH